MASMVNGPPEPEMQRAAAKPQPKPPLKPKPLVLSHRKQNGTQVLTVLEPSAKGGGGEALPNCPPVPARRRSSDVTAGGEVLSNSGNVRKMRELLQQALGLTEGEEAKAERSAQDRARREPARIAPVPRARLLHTPRVTLPTDPSVNGEGSHVPSVAKTAPSDVHLHQDDSEDLESEASREWSEAAGGPEANWRCAPTCPCMCHLERPGMVLVWQPASRGGEEEGGGPEDSQSDSSEEGERTFRYVLHVNREEEEDDKATHGPDWEDPAGLSSSTPVSTGEAVPGDGAHPEGSEPEAPQNVDRTLALEEEPFPLGQGVANQLPKPPRRNRPVGQRSLEGTGPAPPVPRRRLGQHRGPKAERPPHIRQHYAPAHLDRISQCVDGLNLHIQQRQTLRQEQGTPCTTPPSLPAALKPPSPKVIHSAPPSPKEKHLQLYDVVDPGMDEDSVGNDYEVHLEILESSSPDTASQKMTDWESQFGSEPLYQTYRETVINKEIKRQTLVRDTSKTSEDYVYESIPEGSEASPPLSDRPRGPRNTLWQNLSTVRQSGILNELSQRECRLQESMFEVLTSEASYLRSLNVLIEHFMENKDLNESIITRDKKTLFSCITRVKEASESFLKDLEDRVDESIKINDVCDIIYFHAQHNFQVYVDYVRNQFYQEQKYSQLMEGNAQFAAVVVRLQELPRCQRLPLMSFLLLPFQRITRIKMLLENILHRSEVGSVNEVTASKALGLVSKIIDECNREVGVMKQMEEMIHIGKKLEFDKLKAIPIISQFRHLEKRGEVSEIVFRENLFGVKPKVMAMYLFLFNDLLVITNRKSGDRYQVVDHAHRSLVEVQECSANSLGASLGNCFVLTLLENHQGKQCDRLLKTSTESDRHRWMDALMLGKQNLLEDSSDDKIYERWDCPQMQCLIPYTAQQADELSLDPADIINITRKSPEGWYEGCKLSTGQKGWFPSANVQEITNEHVRRRNLRERYRLLQAAQHQMRDSEAPKKADVPF